MSQDSHDLLRQAYDFTSRAVNSHDGAQAYKYAIQARGLAEQAVEELRKEGDPAETRRGEHFIMNAEREAMYAAGRAKDRAFKEYEKKLWLGLQREHKMGYEIMRNNLYPSLRRSR